MRDPVFLLNVICDIIRDRLDLRLAADHMRVLQQGIANSVGNSMVGGTVADMFYAKERGRAMSVFSLVIFVGQVSFSTLRIVRKPWKG